MASTGRKECWANENLPPPVAVDYKPKGAWKTVDTFNTYTAGNLQSSRALILIYDIFGISPQILQGADRLAEYLDIAVLMPDYFQGKGLSHDQYVRDPAGARARMRDIFGGPDMFSKAVQDTLKIVQAAKQDFNTVESWGVFGFCWGGKVGVLAGLTPNTPFKVTGQAHPGGFAIEDAEKMTLPHLCLASKEESKEVALGYKKVLEAKNLGSVHVFENSIHGWMGARADLTDDDCRAQYEQGYAEVAKWMAKHL